MFTSTCFREESVKGVVSTTDCLIAWHLAIWLDTVFETKKLPTGIPDLDTCLADVERNAFTHGWEKKEMKFQKLSQRFDSPA
jgi:hypothetical protein